MTARRMAASAEQTRYQGEPAILLRAGETTVTFLPQLGMTGVSLCIGDHEFLATPGGLRALRGGPAQPWTAARSSTWRSP